MTALVIAAHGTRDADGERTARALTRRVAGLLPDTDVRVGFVELSEPSVPDAVGAALAHTDHVVVVPLMIGTGIHTRDDIPGFLAEARRRHPGARIDYSRHLGREELLRQAIDQRIDAAMGEWRRADTAFVWIGRGARVPQSNHDHLRLAERWEARDEWASVHPGFIQVTTPTLPDALDAAGATGARQVLVFGHWLFPGRLRTWTFEQSHHWAEAHPGVEVRVAEVIGDCDELAQLVVRRFRETSVLPPAGGSPAFVAGLLLDGRDVLVVGGGPVAERRTEGLLQARARVRLVAPVVTDRIAELADAGLVAWQRRRFEEADLDGAWYFVAPTDDPATNKLAADGAEARRTFCVRADEAWGGSAWTPAAFHTHGSTVAVIGRRDPRRTRELRNRIAAALGD